MYGWKWKYPTAEWHKHSINEYLGWELDGDHPAFLKLSHVRSVGVDSREMAEEWDDNTKVHFYYRDWTESGIPLVSKGEVYWSGWWFETLAERDRFVEWTKRFSVKIEER